MGAMVRYIPRVRIHEPRVPKAARAANTTATDALPRSSAVPESWRLYSDGLAVGVDEDPVRRCTRGTHLVGHKPDLEAMVDEMLIWLEFPARCLRISREVIASCVHASA